MFRVLLLVGITASSVANAQSRTSCHLTDDNDNCNRVVACVGNEGTWFNGRAFGRGSGEFSGSSGREGPVVHFVGVLATYVSGLIKADGAVV